MGRKTGSLPSEASAYRLNCSSRSKAFLKKLEQYQGFNGFFFIIFKKYFKSKDIALITILHTFGKDLKFHPHLHLIVAGVTPFKSKFNPLWRAIVLHQLNLSLDRYTYGFYVWCDNIHRLSVKYVGRYVRHPAIANSRIMTYDKNNITFFYKDNRGRKIIITKTIGNFISSLVQHIPPTQFKIVRYYGLYARKKRKLV